MRFSLTLRFILYFGLLVSMTVGFGLYNIHVEKRLNVTMQKMYRHPFTVSNALRDLKISILTVRVELEHNKLQTNNMFELSRSVIQAEKKLAQVAINKIKKRYLGEQLDVINLVDAFENWVLVLAKLVDLSTTDNQSQKEYKEYKRNEQFLLHRTEVLLDYANNKGLTFFTQSQVDADDGVNKSSVILVLITVMAGFFSWSLTHSLVVPITKLKQLIQRLALGDSQVEIPYLERSDELGDISRSLSGLRENIEEMTALADMGAAGDFSISIAPKSDKDKLAFSLNSMLISLRETSQKNDQEIWLQKGLLKFSDALQDISSYEKLANNILQIICQYTEAQIGSLYYFSEKHNNNDGVLKLAASYALHNNDYVVDEIQLGAGLLGQAADNGNITHIKQLPENYIKIHSSLGETQPRQLLLVPFQFYGKLRGVMELGFVQDIDDLTISLLEHLREGLGGAFENIATQFRLQQLIENTQLLAEKNRIAEQRTRTIIESSLTSIITITTRGIIETCNVATENLFGYAKAEMIGQNVKMLMPDSTAKEHDGYLSKYQQTDLASIIGSGREVVAQCKDGSQFHMHLSVAEMKLGDNISYLGMISDISEQVEQREKIRASNQALQANTEEMAAQQEKLRISNEELVANSQKLEQQKLSLENSKQLLEEKTVELENSSKYKSEFLANMSHELRTPLNSLLILSRSLAENEQGHLSDEEVEFAEVIEESGQNLLSLISDILDLSKLEAGQMVAHRESFFISDLVSFLDNRFKHMAEDKGITFIVDVHADTDKVFISDYTKLGQILTNLIGNAIKFTSQGSVTLSIYPSDPMALISGDDKLMVFSVTDTGIGIAEGQQSSIFNAFQQADGATNRIYGGTGLGLSIAWTFAELLGGTIKLDSQKNKGSQFKLYLPILTKVDEISHEDINSKQYSADTLALGKTNSINYLPVLEGGRDKLNIDKQLFLIIEDDNAGALALNELFRKHAYTTVRVKSAEEALSAIKQKSYTAIILDIRLPGMSGFDFLKEATADKNILLPAVFVYTGKDLSDEETLFLQSLAKNIVIKSTHSPERLLDVVRLFLNENTINLTADIKSVSTDKHFQSLVNKKVLLIDDDMRNTFSLAKVLRKKEIIVHIAPSGKDALKILSEQTEIDIVLTDIMMPEMDGYEVIRRIRTQQNFKTLPIIALTANAMPEDKDKCLTAGANDYLVKPVDVEKLLLQMQIWL